MLPTISRATRARQPPARVRSLRSRISPPRRRHVATPRDSGASATPLSTKRFRQGATTVNRSFRLRRPGRPISPRVDNGRCPPELKRLPAAAPDSGLRTKQFLAFSAMTMIAGTLATPAIQPASAAGANIAFQAHAGAVWTTVTSDDVGENAGLSMAPHTTASVAERANGRFWTTFRGNKPALWTLSPQGNGRAEQANSESGTSPVATIIAMGEPPPKQPPPPG
jgi:hypothetical protein